MLTANGDTSIKRHFLAKAHKHQIIADVIRCKYESHIATSENADNRY